MNEDHNTRQSFVPIRQAATFYGVSHSTLRRWDAENRIVTKRTAHGQRRFLISSSGDEYHRNAGKRTIAYCRVSSPHQKDDLRRQIDSMRCQFPNAEIFSDIGSGINWKRPKFNKILDLLFSGNLKKLIIAYPDRLCRFSFELMRNIFERHKVELLVLDNSIKDANGELVEDLLAILQIFVCKINGKRRYCKTKKTNQING